MSSKLLSVILLLVLAACQPLPTALPLSTPEIVRVQVTAATASWREALSGCAETIPQIGLIVDETPTGSLDVNQADLVLRIGPPAGDEAAYPLGTEALEVITNLENPVSELLAPDLEAIYTGQITGWSETSGGMNLGAASGLSIQAWTYLPGEDLTQAFNAIVLGATAPSNSLNVAPSPKAMLEAVRENPGSVGFIPASWVDDTVKTMVTGPELGESLQVEVLALAKSEPQGAVRELVACLQGESSTNSSE